MVDVINDIASAIDRGDTACALDLLLRNPALLQHDYGVGTWLNRAAYVGHLEVIELLIALGCNVNAVGHLGSFPLDDALLNGSSAVVQTILKHGADPNANRAVISAIAGNSKNSLDFIQMMEQHGANLHAIYLNEHTNKPMNALSTAIAWGKQDVVDYLRSKGAVLPDEPIIAEAVESLDDEIVAYFTEHFGPVQAPSAIESVPVDPPVAVHVVPAAPERKQVTLFTTGMSDQPMKVPPGQEAYRHAELFIQLPFDWPWQEALQDMRVGWPVHWLRNIARYPHHNETWLGGPVTIFASGDPPEPVIPGMPFTSFLLLAERSFPSHDGRTIQLYRLMPLFPEERELEMTQGIKALLRAFDRRHVRFVVDLDRPNVALGGT